MPEKYDVVVIGGGPSGSVAAKTLAAGGVKVSLIEKDFKRVKPCGGATPSKSFEEFNLPETGISKKIETVSTISPLGYRIDISFNSGYLAMIERGIFDHSLRKQAEEQGADLIEAEFRGIKEIRSKICITVVERGKERKIYSDFLVAADGINSRASRAIGLKSLPCVYTLQEELDLQAADDFQKLNTCEFWFGSSHAPHFYSWVFPKRDYIDIGTADVNGKNLKNLIEAFKLRRRVYGKGKQRVYRLPLKWRDSLVRGNILFTGDAAGHVMPLSYEGIYYAIKGGKMAAEAIINSKPEQYEKQWNKTFLRQFKLMDRLRKYFTKNDRTVEQMIINLHTRKKVQQAAIRVLFEKDLSLFSSLTYLNFLRTILSRNSLNRKTSD